MNFEFLNHWIAALWRASWQGAIAAAAVYAICRIAPSIPARFQAWLWRLVALKFLVALLWAAPLEIPILPAAPTVARPINDQSVAIAAAPTESPLALPKHRAHSRTPWAVLFGAWAVLVAWQSARLMKGFAAAKRLRQLAWPSEEAALLDRLGALSQSAGLYAPPALLETAGRGSPMLIGMRRPAIVLPAATLARLTESEQSMVLGHELAHVRRRDLFWGFLAAAVRTLFFFHPLAWLCERQVRLSQEIAADEFAIALQKQDAVNYATLLVSVVSKLGRDRLLPTVSVAMAGSHSSLQQRFSAMRFIKPVSRRVVVSYAAVLSMAGVIGGIPWTLVAAETPAGEKVAPPDSSTRKEVVEVKENAGGYGKFVSFKDGTLTLRANSGNLMVWNGIKEDTQAFLFDEAAGEFKPAIAAALKDAKPGTWIQVRIGAKSNKTMTIRIGERKGKTIGTFISYKDDRLLLLGKNLGEKYTKKYGNNVHFHQFPLGLPVYESIDGGEYKLIGPAEKVLPTVKEGTIVTVHAQGDDNPTMIQLGVPASK